MFECNKSNHTRPPYLALFPTLLLCHQDQNVTATVVEDSPGIFSMRKVQRSESCDAEQLRLETKMLGASPFTMGLVQPPTPKDENGISAEVVSGTNHF